MESITKEILNVQFFEPEVQRLLLNNTHGLRMATNDRGIIVGNSIRFPITDIDGVAKETSKGSPIVPDNLYAETKNVIIKSYEASTQLFPEDLNATNSAPYLRSLAAEKIVHQMENKFTDTIINALTQYDDTEMEVGSADAPFTLETLDQIDLIAGNHGWGDNDKHIILPMEARYTLMQDSAFVEVWNRKSAQYMVDGAGTKGNDMNNAINWVYYRGFNIAFIQKKHGRNVVGLPIAEDGSLMGFAWKKSRVGFGSNQAIETRVFEDSTRESNPIIFKSNGSCGAGIIDKEGVIGIKIDPTPLV